MVVVEEIHKDDVGTKMSAAIKEGSAIVDISAASLYNLRFRKPDKTVVVKTGTFETDGSDGIFYYLSEASFFDTVGEWSWQPVITLSGSTWSGDIKEFKVYENLE